jgi:uncharacterized GH25 family protein
VITLKEAIAMKALFRSTLALALLLPVSAEAHKAWLLPSSTVLSGNDIAITVDAAISNDLFIFEHNPLRLDGLTVTGPDNAAVAPENTGTGKYRSTFDVALKNPGTYRIAIASDMLFASYKLKGEVKRWRGAADKLSEIPADAEELVVTQSARRIETFVTAGKPDTAALKPTGKGLEMEPVTHPNDLVAGSEASFKLLLDGKPVANVKVEIVRGGIRYRNAVGEINATTDESGTFKVTWPEAGMYWLEATVEDDKPTLKEAKKRRAGYVATLEVLPE